MPAYMQEEGKMEETGRKREEAMRKRARNRKEKPGSQVGIDKITVKVVQ